MTERTEYRAIEEQHFPVEVNCPTCGRAITLHFNGGELDGDTCCGWTFDIYATGFELAIRPPAGDSGHD